LEVVEVVPETVVVVNWQGCQFTIVLVAPVTVAVSVVDWPKMIEAPTDEVTETETVFALLLPQPSSHRQAKVMATATQLQVPLDLITPTLPR
jgi:hypothetical protein